MSESFVPDLLNDIDLELFIIDKVAPLLVTDNVAESTYHPSDDRMNIAISIHSVIGGLDLPRAIEELNIRPLAFGSAWKALDLLLEHAYLAAGLHPTSKRWRIDEKIAHAHNAAGQAAPLSLNSEVWQRLLAVYAETEQVRH